MSGDASNTRLIAKRQAAMVEVAGIRPGDRLFFYVQRTKQIMGGYEAVTRPFFDQNPLFKGATHINERFPFRVGFKQVVDFAKPIHINDIWASRDQGQIWTMQQARGDAIGRHAYWGLTRQESIILWRMLQELNIIAPLVEDRHNKLPASLQPLPINTSIGGTLNHPCLVYEHALQALLLEDLGDGYHTELFGNYEDFLPSVPTSSGKEMDIVLLAYDNQHKVLWYQILELKKDRFRWEDLKQLLDYEVWLTSGQAEGNPRAVHMAAVANRFDNDVIDHLRRRKEAGQKEVRLIRYRYNGLCAPRLTLEQIVV